MEVVNIAGDPDLEAAHRESLPVVVIDGGPTFRLFLEADALRAALRAAA
ncbi:MAG: hypothetical protein ACKVUT_15735 [Gaiella sp.]